MSKFGPSTLRTLIADIDSLELSHSKKETIKALANAELVRQSGGQLEEFRSWIRKGDAIIAKAQAEIACLKALTDENADLISLSSVLAVLESLQDPASNPALYSWTKLGASKGGSGNRKAAQKAHT